VKSFCIVEQKVLCFVGLADKHFEGLAAETTEENNALYFASEIYCINYLFRILKFKSEINGGKQHFMMTKLSYKGSISL